MQKRKFDELISHFNRKVSDMSIDQKYKMELLGMISAIGFAHEKELSTNLASLGTDCISRQAAIERFDYIRPRDPMTSDYTHGIDVGIALCKVAIREQPPAQLGTNLAEVGTDCISRQAAIDATKKHYRAHDNDLLELIAFDIEQLPPIQPEIVRCKDCKYAEYIDDVQTLWCTECGQGRTVAPNDFCSYAERREVTDS